jgi:16S rRNA (uracil1498-N3)-methyltransferase
MRHRFYVNKSAIDLNNILLPKDVINHINVLRLRKNDEIEIFDGEGGVYIFIINLIDRKNIDISLINSYIKNSNISSIKLNLVMSIIQNDKFDLVLQKAVELGVNEITPIITERTQMTKTDRFANKIQHWHKIIQNSAAQCGQNILPQLNTVINLSDFLNNSGQNSINYICSVKDTAKPFTRLSLLDNQLINILIGPEGGFSNQEESMAVAKGFMPIHMGDLILRAETAAISGICAINILYRNFI